MDIASFQGIAAIQIRPGPARPVRMEVVTRELTEKFPNLSKTAVPWLLFD